MKTYIFLALSVTANFALLHQVSSTSTQCKKLQADLSEALGSMSEISFELGSTCVDMESVQKERDSLKELNTSLIATVEKYRNEAAQAARSKPASPLWMERVQIEANTESAKNEAEIERMGRETAESLLGHAREEIAALRAHLSAIEEVGETSPTVIIYEDDLSRPREEPVRQTTQPYPPLFNPTEWIQKNLSPPPRHPWRTPTW